MAEGAVKCPPCQSEAVVKFGKTSNGKARFRCQQRAEWGRTCLGSYADPGRLPTVKQPIVERTLNGSGIRDIARVLPVGSKTVLRALKKRRPGSRKSTRA
jgi:transposase-like protein